MKTTSWRSTHIRAYWITANLTAAVLSTASCTTRSEAVDTASVAVTDHPVTALENKIERPESVSVRSDSSIGRVSFRRLRIDPNTERLGANSFVLIQYKADFDQAWASMVGTPIPTVDLATEAVLLLAAGQKPSTGFSISVDSIHTNADQGLVVFVTERLPEDCIGPMMIGRPVTAYAIPAGGYQSLSVITAVRPRHC